MRRAFPSRHASPPAPATNITATLERLTQLREAPPDNVEEGWLPTLFDDDHYFLDEAEKLSHELAIVALYKLVEINSKRAIKAASPDAWPAGQADVIRCTNRL